MYKSVVSRLLFSILLFSPPVIQSQAADTFAVTRDELKMMPPYCSAIYGGTVGQPPREMHPLRNTIPNCTSVHHYCDALKYVVRTNKSWNNRNAAIFNWQKAEQSFVSVIGEWKSSSPGCTIYPEAHTLLGNHLLRSTQYGQNRVAEALTNFEAAIQKNKTYAAAYLGLAEAYLQFKDKDKALKALERGLENNPDSKQLARKYSTLGGKAEVFLSSLPAPGDKQENSAAVQAPEKIIEKKTAAENTLPREPGTVHGKSESAPAQKIGSPTNPWCRFCPDSTTAKE